MSNNFIYKLPKTLATFLFAVLLGTIALTFSFGLNSISTQAASNSSNTPDAIITIYIKSKVKLLSVIDLLPKNDRYKITSLTGQMYYKERFYPVSLTGNYIYSNIKPAYKAEMTTALKVKTSKPSSSDIKTAYDYSRISNITIIGKADDLNEITSILKKYT